MYISSEKRIRVLGYMMLLFYQNFSINSANLSWSIKFWLTDQSPLDFMTINCFTLQPAGLYEQV